MKRTVGVLKDVLYHPCFHQHSRKFCTEIPLPSLYKFNFLKESARVQDHAKCSKLEDLSKKLEEFSKLENKDAAAYEKIIRQCKEHSNSSEALELFEKMRGHGEVNKPVFLAILDTIVDANEGTRIESLIAENGMDRDVEVGTALVTMHAEVGTIADACKSFRRIHKPDVKSWNALIRAYCRMGTFSEVVKTMDGMIKDGLEPNEDTYITVMNLCPMSLEEAKRVARTVQDRGMDASDRVGLAVLNMFSRMSSMILALEAFKKTPEHKWKSSTPHYNAMLAGYVSNFQQNITAMSCARYMEENNIKFDSNTFAAVLTACANCMDLVEGLEVGRSLHSTSIEYGLQDDPLILSSLVNMYGKNGAIDEARAVFNKLDFPDVISWSAMIEAYGIQGDTKEALKLARVMQQEGARPSHFTFHSILYACVKDDLCVKYFMDMKTDYGLLPEIEHFRCLVNCLGRKGRLLDGLDMIRRMDHLPHDKMVWYTSYVACNLNGDSKKAEECEEMICKVDPSFLSCMTKVAEAYFSNSYTEARISKFNYVWP